MIPDDFKQQLLNRVDIVDVIERHVPLRKAGQSFMARCPFHNEKSPSFSVSPTKQFYHCFGCGAHGNAITFVMEYLGMGYVDAVKDLAALAGMTVPDVRSPEVVRRAEVTADLGAVTLAAARFFKEQLRKSERAIAYLRSRGVSGEIAARFFLGYAPSGWQGLAEAFGDYASSKALVEAGLVIEGDGGRRYDRFRDRVMFPILDGRGTIIGFGGRVLDGGEPKYLNSPETPLFEKGRELYGLFQARQAVRESGRIVVVEGYMDVVALAQHGVGYAVATLGTATTPVHVQKLLRQTDDLVYCFDGDGAGRRAAWRAMEVSLGQLADGKSIGFLFLPEGEDPDSFVRSAGREAFEARIAQAMPLSEFLCRELASKVDVHTPEGRARLLHLAKPLVTQIPAPALSLIVRRGLAELAQVDVGDVDALFGVRREAARSPAATPRAARPGARTPSIVEVLIGALVAQPALAARVDRSLLDPADPQTAVLEQLLDHFAAQPPAPGDHVVATLLGRFAHTRLGALIVAATGAGDASGEYDYEADFSRAISELKQRWAVRRRAQIEAKGFACLTAEERAEYAELLARGTGIASGMHGEPVTKV
ncbi:MAG: DNA primase [Dehalococcoidia bacterium]|nr:DNA primase [Dehalococcoidia bacterium]